MPLGGVLMPLLILGFVFVVGLFIYYLATTSVDKDDENELSTTTSYHESAENEDIVKDKNVIFLAGDIESMKEKYKQKK